jgi:hypothetical protein
MANPILWGQTREFHAARRSGSQYPCSIPEEILAGHERQAIKTHGQTFERLAQRGGLNPLEVWCIVHDVSIFSSHGMTEAKAIDWLKTIKGVCWKVPR